MWQLNDECACMCNCVQKEVWAEYVDMLCMLGRTLGWGQAFGGHGHNPSVKVTSCNIELLNGEKTHWIN